MTFLNHIPKLVAGYAEFPSAKEAIEEAFLPSVAAEELERLGEILAATNACNIRSRTADQAPHRRAIASAFQRAISHLPPELREDALIAGAGEDEPYALLTQFKQVYLMNLDLAAARQAVAALPKADQGKFIFVVYDLAQGLFEKFARRFAKIRLEGECQGHLIDAYNEHFTHASLGPAYNANFVSSCCTMSQLIVLSHDTLAQRHSQIFRQGPGNLYARYGDLTFEKLDESSIRHHWKTLAHWTHPQGICCFIDTTAMIAPDWRGEIRVTQAKLFKDDTDYRLRFFDDLSEPNSWEWAIRSARANCLGHGFETKAFFLKPKSAVKTSEAR